MSFFRGDNILGSSDGAKGGRRGGRLGLGGPYMLANKIHVALGGGNGLGGITGDDGSSQSTYAGKPSFSNCLEECG